MNQSEFITALQKRYPKGWFKVGDDFSTDGSYNGSVWSGEGAYDNNEYPLFAPYGCGNAQYVMEVRKDLHEFSKKNGWYWESYDCGTFFAYKI